MKTIITTVLLLCACLTQAQLIVSVTGGNEVNVGPGTAGFDFTEIANDTIRSLGVLNTHEADGALVNSHAVGIWDLDTKVLLGSVTVVPSTATDLNGTWYEALAAPITLQAGHHYIEAAFYGDADVDQVIGNALSASTSSKITLGDAVLSSSSGFAIPDLNVSGANLGFFGPNAIETAVPEPAWAGTVFGLLLLGFAFFRYPHHVRHF